MKISVMGVGAVSPLGSTWPKTRDALARGESAVGRIERFSVEGYPSKVGAWVEGDLGADRRMGLAALAAAEAWDDADAGSSGGRLGVFVGAESGRGRPSEIARMVRAAGGGDHFDPAAFAKAGPEIAASFDASVVSPATVASGLAGKYGARGPVATLSLACASGLSAVVEAVRALRAGECELALAGGVGADVDPLMLAGFGKLSALSERGISRPFDLKRDGFVVGEGAAFVVLQRAPVSARVRIAGVGRSLDAHHLTAPHPEGAGAERAMRAALEDGGGSEVRYVQAHGTSTQLNDAVEAEAIARVVPGRPEVGSAKGALGHWIAGAGAIGLLCALEAARSGLRLPTAGLVEVDPACEAEHVMRVARSGVPVAAMCNAFAFGGANASVVVEPA